MVGFFIFLLGLVVGSFINVLIYRLPRNLGFVWEGSRCTKCRHLLSWLDLFPVFSFLFLKGKCRYCQKKISFRYPLVEFLAGASFFVLFLLNKPFGAYDWAIFAIWAGIIALLLVLVFIDFEHFVIPDRILIALGLMAVASAVIQGVIQGSSLDGSLYGGSLWHNILTGVVSALFFFIIYLVSRGKAIGLGDVKLTFVLGFLFGFPGVLIVIYGALAAGTLWGIILILFFGARLKTKIPFGTVLGAVSIIFILLNKILIPVLLPYIFHFYI